MPNEIEDRRQRAREERLSNGGGLTEAIEVATQVKITPTLLNTVRMAAFAEEERHPGDITECVVRAFCDLAGFEVTE